MIPPRVLPLLFLLAVSAPRTAAAAGDAPVGTSTTLLAYVDGGASWPVHPAEFGDFWQAGWSLGAGIGVPLSPVWQLNGHFRAYRHPADGGRQAGDLLLSGPGGVLVPVAFVRGRDLTILTLMAELRFLPPTDNPHRTWYLSFGVGAGEVFTGDATVVPAEDVFPDILIVGDSDGAFSSSMGGGVEIDLSRTLRLTVDAVYTTVFTEGVATQFLPLRLGLALRI